MRGPREFLIVVLFVVVVIAAITFRIGINVYERKKLAVVSERTMDIWYIGFGLELYAQDHNGLLPAVADLTAGRDRDESLDVWRFPPPAWPINADQSVEKLRPFLVVPAYLPSEHFNVGKAPYSYLCAITPDRRSFTLACLGADRKIDDGFCEVWDWKDVTKDLIYVGGVGFVSSPRGRSMPPAHPLIRPTASAEPQTALPAEAAKAGH